MLEITIYLCAEIEYNSSIVIQTNNCKEYDL
jgi:hypothetical protein